ncbi:zona pellucida sperm-binding protein 3-like [Myiozetetes cayanensis]|uniref:zona pellucida sperm-binding protein 3-like n=1 Tax=Myiozetetes cayanensis TaxID=478635 RepID=UPI0021605AC0|nr:zona pellucida sperm-binding protein 3-like [Myiozetetes cayanensis]
MVPVCLLGGRAAGGELILGSGCGVTSADRDGFQLEHPLLGCGTTLELLPSRICYRNILHYHPSSMGLVARARPFSLPVECNYPRTGNISSMPICPTWIPFGSTVVHWRRPRFALAVFDSSWSSHLSHSSYSLGELINVQASLGTDPREPLRVFVDKCVAIPSLSKQPEFCVIADNGCLLDGQLGRSRFLPRHGNHSLRFQLDTLLFPNLSGSQTSLRCHLKAVAPGAGSASGKACSNYREASAWHSLDAGFTGLDCSCCGSPEGCGGRRRRRLVGGGLLGEAGVNLGLLSARPSPAPPEPTPAPPHSPLVTEGDQRDSWLAVPGSLVALVAMCSVLVAVGTVGRYCSVRRCRTGNGERGLGGSWGRQGAKEEDLAL